MQNSLKHSDFIHLDALDQIHIPINLLDNVTQISRFVPTMILTTGVAIVIVNNDKIEFYIIYHMITPFIQATLCCILMSSHLIQVRGLHIAHTFSIDTSTSNNFNIPPHI